MIDDLKLYYHLFAAERYWSWSVLAIAYLAVTLIVRLLIFSKVFPIAKKLAPNYYSAIKNAYLKKSMAGWTLYLLSFLLLIAGWIAGDREIFRGVLLISFCFLMPTFFFLAIIFHLIAFTDSLLEISNQRTVSERGF